MLPDTTSSVYPSTGIRTPPSEMFDPVYKPYVTPPTPFEQTTHDIGMSPSANPYAQSMWWTTRGNPGNEIDKYKSKRKSGYGTKHQKLKSYEYDETKETLDAANSTLWKLINDNALEQKEDKTQHTIKEVDVEVGKAVPIKRTSLMPSLMARPESIGGVEYGDFYNYDAESDADLPNTSPASDKDRLKLDIIQSYTYENTVENELLKPLKAPLPHECLQIQSGLVKKLKCLIEISSTFDQYVEDERMLVNNKVKLYLFSNVKTLFIIHSNFFDAMITKSYMDTEELVFDHLQRLFHVYPSYISSLNIREHFIKLITSNSKFKGFIAGIEKEEFEQIMLSPSNDFLKLLNFLDTYIGESSPRIRSLIAKFIQYYETPSGLTIDFDPKEPLYLEVPNEWRTRHKLHWKEIHGISTARQIAFYLRSELKVQFQEYSKIIKLMKDQIENISRLGVINKYVCVQMEKLEELPGALSDRKTFDVDSQNKQIYSMLDKFVQFINDESFEETETLMKRACKITKRIHNEEESIYVGEKLFDVYMFKKLFQERVYLVFVKFVTFFHEFVGLMDNDGAENVEAIVSGYRKERGVSVVGGWEKFMARGKLAMRFGIKQ